MFLTDESSVGIIGAGPAGISAAANLLAISKITVFEQASSIGGTWRYSDDPNVEHATSMYKNLKIDVPKESMGFPDYPFEKQGDPSFIDHEEVLKYLVKYAEMSKVLPHIKFNSKVISISRTGDGKSKVVTNQNDSFLFDFMIVANGHYTVPYTPEQFKECPFQGEIIHSHYYRRPESFVGKHVTGMIYLSYKAECAFLMVISSVSHIAYVT